MLWRPTPPGTYGVFTQAGPTSLLNGIKAKEEEEHSQEEMLEVHKFDIQYSPRNQSENNLFP